MIRAIFISLFSACILIKGYAQVNNLLHPPDYEPAEYGILGKVEKFGNGPKDMIMIAGWGFDGTLFKSMEVDSIKANYTMYAVTLPGFGDTRAYPMPDQNEVYRDLYWTKGILSALKELIEKEGMEKPVVLSYFTYSNILALRLALDYPDLLDRVIIVSGIAKFTASYPSYEPANLEQRIAFTERVMVQNWWKAIDQSGWNDGNFTPATFTSDSVMAKIYWNQMSDVPIPTMVRYLAEYYCTDLSLEYKNLKVPTLVVIPAFTREALAKPENSFLPYGFHHSWWGTKPSNPNFHLITISDSHAFILDDQPEKLMNVINKFIQNKLQPYDLIR